MSFNFVQNIHEPKKITLIINVVVLLINNTKDPGVVLTGTAEEPAQTDLNPAVQYADTVSKIVMGQFIKRALKTYPDQLSLSAVLKSWIVINIPVVK